VGATTENPSFEVISALLSRARVYVLRPLSVEDLTGLLQAALRDPQRGLGTQQLQAEAAAVDLIARAADGDARRALNMLELAAGRCAWRWRTSDSPIRARSRWRWMAGRLTSASGARKVSWRWPRRWCISPARPRATRCTSPWARRWRTLASSARWMCRCGCATRR